MFFFYFYLGNRNVYATRRRTEVRKEGLEVTEQEVNGGELVRDGFLFNADIGEEDRPFNGVVVADSVATTVHYDDEVPLELAFQDGEIHLETLIRRLVQDVASPWCWKRHRNFAEAPVAATGGVDARKKRHATWTWSGLCGIVGVGRELMTLVCVVRAKGDATGLVVEHVDAAPVASHGKREVGAGLRTRSRTHVCGKELGINFTSPHMAFGDDLCVNDAARVKGPAAVEAEAPGVSAVELWVPVQTT